MRRIKFLSLVALVALVLSSGAGAAQAQRLMQDKQHLTPEEMAQAIVVANFGAPRPNGQDLVYRLASCDPAKTDTETPCYFTVNGSDNFAESQGGLAVSPLSSGATLACGINIYNGAGGLAAILKENVNVTFWGQYGKAPVTMNWGNLNGTWSQVTYNWWNLSGPNPNPGWGTYANTAYATASGTLVWGVPPFQGSQYYSVLLTINSNGWYCQ